MTVDISALRLELAMAKRPGLRQRIDTNIGDFGELVQDCLEIVDEDLAVAAINAIVPEVRGGGGLLEEVERLRASVERFAAAALASDATLAARLPAVEAEHADVVAALKAHPPTPKDWQERVWGRMAVAEARQIHAELERLRAIREAGLKYIAAHRRWKTVHPHDESALMATCRAVSEADEALRKLLETEEKIVADERRARGTP